MPELLFELAFAIYSVAFAHFQVPLIKAMREYVPINNPYNTPFHNRGVIISSIVGAILIVFYYTISGQLWQALVMIPLFIAIYKILFDGYIGSKVYDDFFYIGTSAKQDGWLRRMFPHGDGGEAKAIICGIVVIGLNILYNLV
jgi:hypothetical protein